MALTVRVRGPISRSLQTIRPSQLRSFPATCAASARVGRSAGADSSRYATGALESSGSGFGIGSLTSATSTVYSVVDGAPPWTNGPTHSGRVVPDAAAEEGVRAPGLICSKVASTSAIWVRGTGGVGFAAPAGFLFAAGNGGFLPLDGQSWPGLVNSCLCGDDRQLAHSDNGTSPYVGRYMLRGLGARRGLRKGSRGQVAIGIWDRLCG